MRWPFRAAPAAEAYAGGDAAVVEDHPGQTEHRGWGFAEGEEIAPGRHALQRLGGGSRYEVYLVWDERLFALTVAKVLRPDSVGDARAARELEREADLLERLAHPCLVRAFDLVQTGPHPHLLLEHVEGPTLHRLIRKYGAVSLDQLLPLALHVAAVLHYLSAADVVHLDVKPGNVIMGVPPRLIDLSIARPVASAARLGGAIGTDAYMAPEQCDPAHWPAAIGPAADVWGLGATLYHAATGRVPFPRDREAARSADPERRFPQLVAPPAALPDGIPAPLAEIIARMLMPRPGDRPMAAEVAAALEPLVAAVPDRLVFSRRLKAVPRAPVAAPPP